MTADEVAKILDELGQRLGPAGNHIFEITVRQTFINAWLTVIVALASFVGLLLWAKVSVRWYTNWNTNTLPKEEIMWTLWQTLIIFLLLTLFTISVCTVIFGGTISAILNPEYAAMETLLRIIRGR